MQDDFRTCGKALKATQYAIGLANEVSFLPTLGSSGLLENVARGSLECAL